MSVVEGNEPTQSPCAVILMVSPGMFDRCGWKPFIDSGLLFCFQAGVQGVEVQQSPSVLKLYEGTSSALSCNFSISIMSLQWFQQNPRGSFINLFYQAPGTKTKGRLKSTFDSKERYSTLHIRDAQLEDSGTYFCAAEAQCFHQACSLAPNCSCSCSYSPDTGRLYKRLFTVEALSDHQLQRRSEETENYHCRSPQLNSYWGDTDLKDTCSETLVSWLKSTLYQMLVLTSQNKPSDTLQNHLGLFSELRTTVSNLYLESTKQLLQLICSIWSWEKINFEDLINYVVQGKTSKYYQTWYDFNNVDILKNTIHLVMQYKTKFSHQKLWQAKDKWWTRETYLQFLLQ